jgi:hypothetical protein
VILERRINVRVTGLHGNLVDSVEVEVQRFSAAASEINIDHVTYIEDRVKRLDEFATTSGHPRFPDSFYFILNSIYLVSTSTASTTSTTSILVAVYNKFWGLRPLRLLW